MLADLPLSLGAPLGFALVVFALVGFRDDAGGGGWSHFGGFLAVVEARGDRGHVAPSGIGRFSPNHRDQQPHTGFLDSSSGKKIAS